MGMKVLFIIGGILAGLVVQMFGVIIDKFIYIEIYPTISTGLLGNIIGIAGFVVMGICIYKGIKYANKKTR